MKTGYVDRLTNSRQPRSTVRRFSQDIDFHGACVVDDNGAEIPITDEMVQLACRQLHEVWERTRHAHEPPSLRECNISYTTTPLQPLAK